MFLSFPFNFGRLLLAPHLRRLQVTLLVRLPPLLQQGLGAAQRHGGAYRVRAAPELDPKQVRKPHLASF